MVCDWPGSYHLYKDPATCAVCRARGARAGARRARPASAPRTPAVTPSRFRARPANREGAAALLRWLTSFEAQLGEARRGAIPCRASALSASARKQPPIAGEARRWDLLADCGKDDDHPSAVCRLSATARMRSGVRSRKRWKGALRRARPWRARRGRSGRSSASGAAVRVVSATGTFSRPRRSWSPVPPRASAARRRSASPPRARTLHWWIGTGRSRSCREEHLRAGLARNAVDRGCCRCRRRARGGGRVRRHRSAPRHARQQRRDSFRPRRSTNTPTKRSTASSSVNIKGALHAIRAAVPHLRADAADRSCRCRR